MASWLQFITNWNNMLCLIDIPASFALKMYIPH